MTTSILHAFDFLKEKCTGRLLCMRVCPTEAIRVKDARALVDETLCIDCGECLVACPEGAFRPRTDPWESIERFRFKLAIPSPSLFGQFPLDVTPRDIVDGLLALGFDAVYGTSIEAEIINLAIRDYLDGSSGPYPLISSSCPVVVRLIQVAYPDMVDQVIPIEPPRELAGREGKRLYAKKTGLPEKEIGAIYLSPCTAKVAATKQPAEGGKSYLDLAIGISDIYNRLYAVITKLRHSRPDTDVSGPEMPIMSRVCLGWETRGGQCTSLKPSRYISVSQLPNVIRIFDDIEKGKIDRIDFLECYACAGGCIGGPLTVDDMFVSSSKVQKLMETMEEEENRIVTSEANRRYSRGDYFIRKPLRPRPTVHSMVSFEERVERMKVRDRFGKILPGLDCGLCGAPSCNAFAGDIANGRSESDECIFLSARHLKRLRQAYRVPRPRHLQTDETEGSPGA